MTSERTYTARLLNLTASPGGVHRGTFPQGPWLPTYVVEVPSAAIIDIVLACKACGQESEAPGSGGMEMAQPQAQPAVAVGVPVPLAKDVV